MAALESQILKEGFLDVKVPRGSHERKLIKAWRRMWVSAAALFPVGRGEPHFILNLSKKPEESPEKRVKTPRDGLHLFRCRSSSRPFCTWALSSGNTLLLYLAAETELQAQEWMQIMRDGLWPPLSPFQMLADSHDVSLIDDEKSFAAGLLGIYGRLTLTSGDAITVFHSHWGGVLLRFPISDIQEVNLVRTAGSEKPEAGVFSVLLCSKENTGLKILQFHSFSAVKAVEWLSSLTKAKESVKNQKSPETNKELFPNPSSTTCPSQEIRCEYAVVRKNTVINTQQLQEIPSINIEDESTYGKIEQSKGLLNRLGDIPYEFLDASISSSRPNRADTDESSSSTEDENMAKAPWMNEDIGWPSENVYEHIYEELKSRRETIYEEIDPEENEYIPPLPPPMIPKPPPTQEDPISLRLLKLSDSVSEALKLAETTPPTKLAVESDFKHTVVGRCKSDQFVSIQNTIYPTNDDTEIDAAPVRRRTLSEPEVLSDSLLYVNALPLVAFNSRTGKKQPSQQTSSVKVKEKQPSLMDFLQSLNPKNTGKLNGNSKIVFSEDNSGRRKSSADAQYIDMRHKK